MNDDAIAYGFASLVVLLVVAALLWVMFIPFVNAMGTELNEWGADEKASTQTFSTFTLVQMMYTYGVPIFVLMIGFYYAINRALLKRKEEMYG